ncbi:hypothetical protein [Brevundimonas diminuta]|uniref:hypothetical protein n=1 Tax=Brevundimonas diminuta TaxID=293 RepID=UPI0032082310
MIRRLHRIIDAEDALSFGDPEPLLDEEAWAAPERLSADDCFDQLGSDWRSSAAPHDPEDER